MTKFFAFYLVFAFITVLNAQVTLQHETHAIKADDFNRMKICNYAEPGPAGTNLIWDFSDLAENKDFTGFVHQVATSENNAEFRNSNTELIEFNNRFYFNITENSIEQTGLTTNDNSVIIKYTRPFVKMKFPFTMGDAFSGHFEGTYQSKYIEGIVDGNYTVEADAYGTLLLPGDVSIKNTLRVKTVKTYDRIFENSIQHVIITTFRWYNSTNRYPLLVFTTINTTSGKNTSTARQAAYNNKVSSSAIQDAALSASNLLDFYPNPVNDDLNINFQLNNPGKVLIDLYDISGKKLCTLINEDYQPGSYDQKFDIQHLGLRNGSYLMKASLAGKHTTKEFIVSE